MQQTNSINAIEIRSQLKNIYDQIGALLQSETKAEKKKSYPTLADLKGWARRIMDGDEDLGLGKPGLFSILKNLGASKLSDLTDENKIKFVEECEVLLS